MGVAGPSLDEQIATWRRDPHAFIGEVLVNPETGRPFDLFAAQAAFLREMLTSRPNGCLPYVECRVMWPKKSGKSTLAAMATLYVVVVLGGPYAEGYVIANDLEQAQSRVFTQIVRLIQAMPVLRRAASVTVNKITFRGSGATIAAITADYDGEAGANQTIVTFDEAWAYTSERSRRLFDEYVPVPTRLVSVRLTTTYAGFTGKSTLLERLYTRGMSGGTVRSIPTWRTQGRSGSCSMSSGRI